jgi:hypothetical protein
MIIEHKSPETFFTILNTVKKLEEAFKSLNAEIHAEFGPDPENQIDFRMSWLSQARTTNLSHLLYWKEELYEQINNN